MSDQVLKERRKASSAKYYAAHKDLHAQRVRSWKQKNKEHWSATQNEWRKANRESHLATRRAWNLANRGRVVVQRRQAYKDNRAKLLAAAKSWREKNRDTVIARRHKITVDHYVSMREAQHNLCASCLQPPSGKRNETHLHVDHCHATGKVRGLLCGPCNRALGLLKDDADTIERLSLYMRKGSIL